MTSRDDTDPTRRIDLEIEVPGSPEEVWAAIATGPGITSWMHPTEVEGREGGVLSYDMGYGPQSADIVGWEPPRRFATAGALWQPPGEATPMPLATEWLVRAVSGDTCLVRMVMSGFGDGESWQEEIDGMARQLWVSLLNLRLYLTHFRGRHGTWLSVASRTEASPEQAWARLTGAVGLAEAVPGARTASAAPLLQGTVEYAAADRFRHDLLLRVGSPAPGLAALRLFNGSGQVSLQAWMFGDAGLAVTSRDRPVWQNWLDAVGSARVA